jgi:D-alanyl-lipoteichoic acid acyltransferase DltB (MBOAT superfamily)
VQFNSYIFLIFFAAVLAVHNAPLSWRTKKFNLLAASYLFYAAWNPPYVLLIVTSTVIDWEVAKRIQWSRRRATRRALLLVSLSLNLGMLGFFKYAGFLVENFADLMALLGVDFQPAAPSILLPVGISFYTFQTLSYTIDVYLGRARPWFSFLDYALYVTFFPQLVAGPIVRAIEFLPQCVKEHRPTAAQLGWGLSLLILGIFQKNVVADVLLAPVAEKIYAAGAGAMSFADAWMGTLAFAGQIFCDFAGYSTCAIGVAMCLGFALPDNFGFPYAAIGFSDFWRRWHISLSSWLRDYLYIPLGGNRTGPVRTHVNLMVTMLLGGLWHGASWTFVFWGALHGAYLVVERLLKRHVPDRALWRHWLFRLGLALFTFALICFTWVFFRASSFGQAFQIAGSMLGLGAEQATDLEIITRVERIIVLATMSLMLVFHWLLRDTTLEHAAARTPWPVRALLIAFFIAAILGLPGEDRAFIYFQF